MAEFKKKFKADGTYRAPGKGEMLNIYSDEQVSEWANDPACTDRVLCANEFERRTKVRMEREAESEKKRLAEEERISNKRKTLEANPFDPRTEVSADAMHIAGRIVTTLWIIFVLLPIVAGLLIAIMK